MTLTGRWFCGSCGRETQPVNGCYCAECGAPLLAEADDAIRAAEATCEACKRQARANERRERMTIQKGTLEELKGEGEPDGQK